MATSGRSENTDLARWPIAELLEQEPYLFEFFQAIRLMARIDSQREVVGRFNNPSAEVVRFAANPDVSFPASEIQSLEQRDGKAPLMRVNFIGLHGPQGILPRAYCELVNERIRARDKTLRDFFDLFNHRIISLFYQAWEKFHFEIPYERGELDRFSHYVLALLGLDAPGLQNRQDVADDSLLFYGGLLSMHSRSATGLRQVLWDYFNVPVEIEQFVGAWYPVDEESQCCLGEDGSYSEQLGFGAVVGNETWDQQSRVRIQLGPLTLEQYVDFLPGHEGHRQLRSLTQFYASGEYDMEVQLILRRDQVPACELKAHDGEGQQLGWTSWMKSAEFVYDAGETVLELSDSERKPYGEYVEVDRGQAERHYARDAGGRGRPVFGANPL